MNNVIARRAMSRRAALVGALSLLFARGARAAMGNYSESLSGKSGEAITCNRPHWRVDAQGREWPVSIKVTAPPLHGHVGSRRVKTVVRVNGKERTVTATEVVYRSQRGFVGIDRFSFVRLTKDPTDPYNDRATTIAVTVR
jgi:hypothetical protein